MRTFLTTATFFFASVTLGQAQGTLTLNQPITELTDDATIQGGASANTNFGALDYVATRASDNPDYRRRALFKFDTQNTIAEGKTIQSATLTLTIKTANSDPTRILGVYPVTTSFLQAQSTWNDARSGVAWTQAGGDLGMMVSRQTVGNVVGSKVDFDVTKIVAAAVSGANGSRYSRIALTDLGASTANSYREFYSSEATDPSVRPALTIVFASATTTSPPIVTTAPALLSSTTSACTVGLSAPSTFVGVNEANWGIFVTAAASCAWKATSNANWLVVTSTSPTPSVGNGSVRLRANTNTTSAAKRTATLTVAGVAYLVTQSGCGSSCTTPAPTLAPASTPSPNAPVSLRVMQYNLHHGGWGTDGVYDPNRIVDWVMTANPDVISMNEVEVRDSWSQNTDQPTVYQALLEQRTGVTWYAKWYSRYGTGTRTGIGEMILSKYPFVATAGKNLGTGRSAIDATIVVNGRTINFTSAHLDNVTQANRISELNTLLPWESAFAEDRVVLGDFNAWPDTTEIAMMDANYVDTWTAAQALGTAVGNGMTHSMHRIDYVFQSKGAANLTLVGQTICDTADANGVMPSDHNPVLAVFRVR